MIIYNFLEVLSDFLLREFTVIYVSQSLLDKFIVCLVAFYTMLWLFIYYAVAYLVDHWTNIVITWKHTHTRLTALCLGLSGWASTRKVKPIWILLEQETVSGSGISWTICKSVLRSRQITTPAPHRSVFYRPDALPVTKPTASKHFVITWKMTNKLTELIVCVLNCLQCFDTVGLVAGRASGL